jgi:hypothetical protein
MNNELFTALAKAQSEFDIAGNNSVNPHFRHKYASLADLVKASRPALCKHGLSVIQRIVHDNAVTILESILGHASGQFISSSFIINPIKTDIQSLGSYLTYLRRYAYAALVGVISQNEDDDGEQAISRENNRQEVKEPSKVEKITLDQLEQLQYELTNHTDIAEDILQKMNISSLAELPKYTFQKSIDRIRTIKSAKKSH